MKQTSSYRALFAGAFVAAALVGCGQSKDAQVQQAVEDNQKANSIVEWESSEHNPEALFEKWREQAAASPAEAETTKKEVCEVLGKQDGLALSLFEEEINNAENASLLTDCKTELLEQLDIHYADQRSRLNVAVNARIATRSLNGFQFPDNVQLRDTSNGYYAVSGDVGRKEVILTFDDGPSGVYTPSILRSLKEVNAKAIFFALGKSVRANPGMLKQVAADGHAIGSHSVTHRCLGTRVNCARSNGRLLSFQEASDEIKGGHQAIFNELGWVDPFFRFPFGESSPELKSFLKTSGVGEFFWSIDSEDWKAKSNDEMLRSTIEQIEKRGRGVVLFHDIQRKTAETMPAFLRELHSRGYSIVLLKSADANARYNSKLVKKNLP